MASNQEGRQQSARAISGTALDYNSDFLAMFAAEGFTVGTFNERFLLWLNNRLGVTHTSLPAAMQAFAVAHGALNWSGLANFTPGGAGDGILMGDGFSGILMGDGTSYILMGS